MKNSSPNGQLDLQLLGPLLSPPIPKNALQGLFNAFDENRDGHIDFKELCCGVSAACRGPGVERTRCKMFCFFFYLIVVTFSIKLLAFQFVLKSSMWIVMVF